MLLIDEIRAAWVVQRGSEADVVVVAADCHSAFCRRIMEEWEAESGAPFPTDPDVMDRLIGLPLWISLAVPPGWHIMSRAQLTALPE